ncbi:MAG: hypothetical protein JWQ02_3706 [Capsulimonas sp.]|nr:hypothetical protein [Capsulimonas sp.]
MKQPTLDQLFRTTMDLFARPHSFAAGLDWIDRVLPHFTAACCDAVAEGTDDTLKAWREWLTGTGGEAIREAGDAETFLWRRAWLTLLINTAIDLRKDNSFRDDAARKNLASTLAERGIAPFATFPPAFWRATVEMLAGSTAQAFIASDFGTRGRGRFADGNIAPHPPITIAFPLVLSEQMVVGGESINVLVANLKLEFSPFGDGQIFPDPAQMAIRCFDPRFGGIFAQAAEMVLRHIAPTPPPSVSVRLIARKPEHEVFLQKLVLRGGSAGGALAMAFYAMAQRRTIDQNLAVSFALAGADETATDNFCHAVGGAYEKARGCARENIKTLVVSTEQASQVGFYGHLQSVVIVGAMTIAEAFQLVDSSMVVAAPPTLVSITEDGGVLPLGSPLYLERRSDQAFHAALDVRPMIVLVKGPRQIGKTSLLVRGVDRARQSGAKLVYVDLQSIGRDGLRTQRDLFSALSRIFARELGLDVTMDDMYDDRDGPNKNFENFLFKHVLGSPVIWFMDEVDRLFDFDFYTDVFSLMRSWHNRRPVHSELANLTLVLSYATETHLLIEDIYQSPFNVGVKVELEDFRLEQVAELNNRLHCPLKSDEERQHFYGLVGGHPHLVCRGLSWMSQEGKGIDAFAEQASRDNGPFGAHLRRLRMLSHNPDQLGAIQDLLSGKPCRSADAFLHLRSAGVLVGDDCRNAEMRCRIYADYLRGHILPGKATQPPKTALWWRKLWRAAP